MEVRFYHLTSSPLERALPALLQKAVQMGKKIALVAPDERALNTMNDGLWAWDPNSFIPHACAPDNAEGQPVWLTLNANDNANAADMLILTGNASCDDFAGYTLCCEMLNGHDMQAVEDARSRWKIYKEQGFDLTYWQQKPNGGWEKKA